MTCEEFDGVAERGIFNLTTSERQALTKHFRACTRCRDKVLSIIRKMHEDDPEKLTQCLAAELPGILKLRLADVAAETQDAELQS